MKQKSSLIKSESGVIHHLGLILFAVALVGIIAFAVFRIQATDNDPNFTVDESSLTEEDQAEAELNNVSQESEQSLNDADKQLDQVSNDQEDNDES